MCGELTNLVVLAEFPPECQSSSETSSGSFPFSVRSVKKSFSNEVRGDRWQAELDSRWDVPGAFSLSLWAGLAAHTQDSGDCLQGPLGKYRIAVLTSRAAVLSMWIYLDTNIFMNNQLLVLSVKCQKIMNEK